MPVFTRPDVSIHYEDTGSGFPVVLFAPGGMRSSMPFWERAPWNPRTELANDFRLIALDQRNAGGSTAKIQPTDGWQVYAEDHIALLDHLGIEQCHAIGGCIGSSFALGLIQAAPNRVVSAVLQNPIGLYANRDAFYTLFDGWIEELRQRDPKLSEVNVTLFREHMYGGQFVFNTSRSFVRSCGTPLLILCGSDLYHPTAISQELAQLAPNATLVEGWKDRIPETITQVREFLRDHTPR